MPGQENQYLRPLPIVDDRSKEQLKADGDYTPEYWRQLKAERGYSVKKHGNRTPKSK